MNRPKISVLMPVYNGSEYLSEAIDSILNQTYENWELIIINDGSTDNSEAIIHTYTDSRIKYFKNDQNIGLIATLNRGINLSSGEYIARMDADDISVVDRFQHQVAFLDTHNNYAMCGTDAIVIDKDGKQTGKILNLRSNEYLQINLLFSVPFVHPSVMIRSESLKNNFFDHTYSHAEDYDMWCRIASKHEVANIPLFLLKYRWHTSNVSVVYQEKQDEVKDQIIKRELQNINLKPTSQELKLHTITFRQYDAKSHQKRNIFTDYGALQKWFEKIIQANLNYPQKYDSDSLVSYLWSRWIVLCISQHNFRQILKPRFVPFRFKILKETLKLLLFYSKK